MLTVPYEFYKETYGGDLSEEDFLKKLTSVVVDVDYFTFNRLRNQTDEAVEEDLLSSYRELCCKLVDISVSYDSNGGAVVKSQSSGKVSESYLESSLPKSRDSETQTLVDKYLCRYNLCCMWV